MLLGCCCSQQLCALRLSDRVVCEHLPVVVVVPNHSTELRKNGQEQMCAGKGW